MRKKVHVNHADLFLSFYLDYLEPDEWVEIIWRSNHVHQSQHPIHPVYRAETIKTEGKGYQLKTVVAPLPQLHTQLLLYFDFHQIPDVVHETNFFVSICSQFSLWTQEIGPIYYQNFYQKYVQLFSYEPAYLISISKSKANITLSSFASSTIGTFKVYLTAAPHLILHEGSRYNVCDYIESYNEIDFKKCLSKKQSSKHFYIYYNYHKERSWNEASDYCKSLGGYLPIVRSRGAQDEIISIFNNHKSNTIPKPQFGMYLGLKIHKVCAFVIRS